MYQRIIFLDLVAEIEWFKVAGSYKNYNDYLMVD